MAENWHSGATNVPSSAGSVDDGPCLWDEMAQLGDVGDVGCIAVSGFAAPSVDWQSLRDEAVKASTRAYAPYSGYPVGAAALLDDGTVVSAANVENASYGLTLCAECGLVSQVGMRRPCRLVAVVCVNGSGQTIAPCGRCRQLLFEFAAESCQVLVEGCLWELRDLLPAAFGPAHLPGARSVRAEVQGTVCP